MCHGEIRCGFFFLVESDITIFLPSTIGIFCFQPVLKIDEDSLYYVDEYPIVAIPYQFAGDSMSLDYWGNTIVQHISFRKDTLVMKNQWGDVSCFVPVK